MLDVRLFGSPTVTVDGEPIEVDTRKAIALLAYLAIETSADRDALAALFWADSSPDRAKATLRRTLSALRGGAGPDSLETDRQQVRLKTHQSDVARFERAVEETASHDHDPSDVCPRCVPLLTEAASLYRDDFLGSFHVRDAPDFEDWARPVTESLRIKAGEVFARLAVGHAANGDYPSAIEVTSRWIALDELHEPAHRQLMLLHAWAGDRPGAIEAYNACVAVLDRELGVAPLEETTELFEAILDEDLPPAPAQPRSSKPVKMTRAKSGTTDMIDRQEAVDTLTAALLEVSQTGQVCVVTGDSWMGKTRLLEHLIDEAVARGHRCVSARAFRAESQLPFGVAIQLLHGLLAQANETAIAPWALAELARLEPRLAPGQALPGSDRQGQLRLAEAFLNLIEVTATDSPLLIIVDDLQWVDPASAGLISYLIHRIGRIETTLALGSRTLDTLPGPLDDLAAIDATFIHLIPLVSDDLEDLPDADLDGILRATGGIPLLVKEAIETGITPDSPSVLRYMESRRNRLSDLARQVMAAAAVLDGMCDAGLLRDTSGRTDEEVVEAVEELVTAGLLREEGDGLLAFTLDVLETVTYEATSLIRRRLLHRRAAEAMEARSRSRIDARLATAIAGHLSAAGSEEAADWYRLSGDLARAVFANDEAVVSYETAIALDHSDVAGLRLNLGELAMARGDYPTATRELRAAAAQSKGSQLALVEHRIGDLNRILGRFELAEESFATAERDHPEPVELYADWALLRHRIGDDAGAVELAGRAMSLAESGDEPVALARAVNILGVVTTVPDDAMSHLDRALDLTGNEEPGRMAALNNKAHLVASGGDLPGAMTLVQEAIDIARRSGYRHHQAALLNHLADLEHKAGNADGAEAALTEAVTIFADIVAGDWEPEVWLLREW